MLAARFVRVPHGLGIDWIFRLGFARIVRGDVIGDLPFELAKRRPGECVNLPRLQVAARSRARGARDEFAHEFGIDRLVEEPAAGESRVDCFEYIHVVLSS